MLEIYNETIRDLLVPKGVTAQDGGASKYSIKHDANGNTSVSDLTVVDVTSISEVSSLLRRAAQSRLNTYFQSFSIKYLVIRVYNRKMLLIMSIHLCAIIFGSRCSI